MSETEALLTPEETAKILGVRPRTLQAWRYKKRGPEFVRLGHKTVRYSPTAISTYIKAVAAGNEAREHPSAPAPAGSAPDTAVPVIQAPTFKITRRPR